MKKYLIFTIIIAVATIGIFLVGNNAKKTFYIKNDFLRPANNVEFGNLQDTIIPSILKAPKNLTEDLAGVLARGIISKNSEFKAGDLLPGPGISAPNPSQIVQDYIKSGLKIANENIFNIAPIRLTVLQDNSKDAIAAYLSQAQKIINENLGGKNSQYLGIIKNITENNGAELEKLSPIIIANEATANQLEEIPVPADLKNLMTEEIRLLRVSANIFKALINAEADPLATLTAINQFGTVGENWRDFQKKFDVFLQKLNRK